MSSAVKLPGVFHNSWEMIAKSFLAAGIRVFCQTVDVGFGIFSRVASFLSFKRQPGPSNIINPSGFLWGQP